MPAGHKGEWASFGVPRQPLSQPTDHTPVSHIQERRCSCHRLRAALRQGSMSRLGQQPFMQLYIFDRFWIQCLEEFFVKLGIVRKVFIMRFEC
jgi:hypothetical protein